MFNLVFLVLLSCSVAVFAAPGIVDVSYYTDNTCTTSYNPADYNINDNRAQWYNVDASNVATIDRYQFTNDNITPCIVAPYSGVASAQFACIEGQLSDGNYSQYLRVTEFWNRTDCPVGEFNVTASYIRRDPSGASSCISGAQLSDTQLPGAPSRTYAKFTCGKGNGNSGSSVTLSMNIALFVVVIAVATILL